MSRFPLDAICECGHTFDRHAGGVNGHAAHCMADGNTCPCANFIPRAGSTDAAELAPDDRPTLPPQTLELQIAELQAALGESNALSILSREASLKSSNLCLKLLQRLQDDERHTAHVERRGAHVERHLRIEAAE